MSQWAIFDVQGGAARRPACQITIPIFDRVTLHLHPGYALGRTFTITTRKNSPANLYIQSAALNDRALEECWFEHDELANGGALELELAPVPTVRWSVGVHRAATP